MTAVNITLVQQHRETNTLRQIDWYDNGKGKWIEENLNNYDIKSSTLDIL